MDCTRPPVKRTPLRLSGVRSNMLYKSDYVERLF